MEKNFYKTYFTIEENNWWFRVRRNLIFDLLQKYKVSKTAKIFDFGCGSGYTVGYLQKLGYDTSGSDISAEAIEFGLSKDVRNIAVARSGEIEPPEGNFDLILALDVIEHIEDDLGAIGAIERALRPGGMAILTVPAYQWLWGVQDEVAHHFRRYTMTGLTSVVKRSGDLTIIHKTYFNTFLFLPIAVVRMLSKWFNLRERESDFDISNGILNSIFYFIFNLETYFLKLFSFPFGVSILFILKKND
ncbi:MAG: class I SAM-dependent methyltransferase [bacterium]|nr:class I SAM-dependent methyltransferase [bacterium]